MTEDEIKLSQNQKDIDRLNEENAEIQARIDAAKEPKWLAAVSKTEERLILNLTALSGIGKSSLKNAIDENKCWISFVRKGFGGIISSTPDGLTFYPGTKIVF